MKLWIVVLLATSGAQEDPDRAVVTLSDGKRFEGRFFLTQGHSLRGFDLRRKKWLTIDPREIARIGVRVEEEGLQQGWMFKEESDHTKIKLPFRYPVRKLLTEITLRTGQMLSVHVTAVLYLETLDEDLRFFLHADQRGEKGQILSDLVYTKEVVFPHRPVGRGKLGTLRLRAPGLRASIVSVDRDVSLHPPFTGLLPGKYDLFLKKNGLLHYGLSGSARPGKEEVKGMQKKVDLIEDFFDRKRIVDARREGDRARALVELTRVRPSHDKDRQGRPYRYARWEVWILEPTQESWEVRRRLFLFRDRITADQGLLRFRYEESERLRGVKEDATVEYKMER